MLDIRLGVFIILLLVVFFIFKVSFSFKFRSQTLFPKSLREGKLFSCGSALPPNKAEKGDDASVPGDAKLLYMSMYVCMYVCQSVSRVGRGVSSINGSRHVYLTLIRSLCRMIDIPAV